MIAKKFSKSEFRIIAAIILGLLLICFWSVFLTLWATKIDVKALSFKTPSLRSEKLIYYKDFYHRINQAIKKNPDRAE
ncbi:MAG: hypothetical protein JW867_02830, partial [Candidatus Omnitrophica bacterium]|nr:hypothetical protein [Candidatus Omnitrophota bacterium]